MTRTTLPIRGRLVHAALHALVVCAIVTAAFASGEKITGIVESVGPNQITVDSAVAFLRKGGRITGEVNNVSKARVGWWAELEGRWTERGLFEASRIDLSRDAPGESYAEKLSKQSLEEVGKLEASDKIYRNPAVNEYVSKVGDSLVPDYARKSHQFSFGIIQDPTLNAFALPGGAVYVHTGLLARLDNEAQLGVVLGHEIGHVTQKHGQRQYKKSMSTFLPAQIGAILLGVQLDRHTNNPFQSFMIGLGLNLGLSAAVSGYGRTLEDQADRVGLRYAVETGYDPKEGPKIWDTFNDVYGDEGKVENFFYGNHSTNGVRKGNLREEIDRHYSAPPRADLVSGPGDPSQPAVKTRLVNEEIYQTTMLDLTRANAVEDFGLKRYHLASNGFARVLKYRPGDPVAHHYSGRIILATDESEDAPQRALSEYLKSVSVAPEYPDVHRDLGRLYAKLNRPADARAHLRTYLELAPAEAKDRKDVEKELKKLGDAPR